MKAIKCDLPYAEQIEIHPMADLHLGDPQSDYKSIIEKIEYKNKKYGELNCFSVFFNI